MHALTQIYHGGHLYGPGGIGWREYDPAQLLTAESIADTRNLPGFVEDHGNHKVTYESHRFWVHFLRYTRTPDREVDSAVLIRVNHGGGWEVWRGDNMLARALRRYGENDQGLFLLCWFLIDAARSARAVGCQETAREYRKAFVDGRLKKRKLPARGATKVWIEPEPQAILT